MNVVTGLSRHLTDSELFLDAVDAALRRRIVITDLARVEGSTRVTKFPHQVKGEGPK